MRRFLVNLARWITAAVMLAGISVPVGYGLALGAKVALNNSHINITVTGPEPRP